MDKMITENPVKFWNRRATFSEWREYILPKRTDEQFEEEGKQNTKHLSPYIKETDIVLEYGCGIGRVLKYIKAKRKIGLDITLEFLKRARLKDTSSEYYLVDDFNEKVDFIYSLAVVQHNTKKERQKIFNNIYKLLKDGGKAFIQFPRKGCKNYHEGRFVHVFTKEEVEEYGKMFSSYEILEGNLFNFKEKDNDEYKLIVTK